MRFRKKPVIIEAIQWNEDLKEIGEFIPMTQDSPFYLLDEGLFILTLEGKMKVSNGDWIIKGINGEFYPCKPDIFEKTYEKVEEN